MAGNLMIVESPAKAKTIEGFLGSDFIVKSSYGHVRDLPKKDVAIDIQNNFHPTYEISSDKRTIIAELTKLAKQVETVWLATDEDREGEAISWHLAETLKLKKENTRRIVFHEITKQAIQDAVKNPRSINKDLVDAQQARRILDRLVGFELSPVLWKKVKPKLSAGRVQSVAVRLIVDREREITAHKSVSSFKVSALFPLDKKGFKGVLKAELSNRLPDKISAEQFLNKCINAQFSIGNLEMKPAKRSPSAPFTTSTLQQEASRKLGFSVSRTMTVAQKLYESGKITYMRTDSVNMSESALSAAAAEIEKSYGKSYIQTRRYTTKSKGAQEAHEAIRPAYMNLHGIEGDASEKKLYDLIWKRAVASQMSDAVLEKTTATIDISTTREKLVAQGEMIKFEGFLKVYLESSDDEDDEDQKSMLPPVEKGEMLYLDVMSATEKFSQHPPRYTEASLVKKLEEQGIGRPSTYAPTISTIQARGYVEKKEKEGTERIFEYLELKQNKVVSVKKTEITGAEKFKLFPTDIGAVVNDFLVENFKVIMDLQFTAKVEKEFDEIAQGSKQWADMIGEFYHPFHKNVIETEKTSERATGERVLGQDPVSGKPIIAKIGRYGPLVQIGSVDDEEKPRFASLRVGQSIETITIEEALDLFKLPRIAGDYEGMEMVVAIGRFGPYVRHNKSFYSIPKSDDPLEIKQDRAIEIIEAKRKADREKTIKVFPDDADVQVLNGRYGPYIAFKDKNVRIPKGTDPATLTLKDCYELSEKQGPSKGKTKPGTKKTTATKKKTTPKKRKGK